MITPRYACGPTCEIVEDYLKVLTHYLQPKMTTDVAEGSQSVIRPSVKILVFSIPTVYMMSSVSLFFIKLEKIP